MPIVTVLLIAIGVSADAFAVSLGRGLRIRDLTWRDAAVLSAVFGAFQAMMPLIGWLLGAGFSNLAAPFDHWIAFALLAVIGVRMIWQALSSDHQRDERDGRPTVRELLVLGLATSVDALAVGIGLAFIAVPIGVAVVLIGLVTGVVAFAGVFVGHRVGLRFAKPAEIGGGLILIGLGVSILVDHLTA